ncbi:hypothetical protein QBC44DRAFT_113337 [Cladorrhinum sp. PSN332]|nr:hypothetical protein QBC44DRAFT_113337 [Cladorrhinum sp. PSN332]
MVGSYGMGGSKQWDLCCFYIIFFPFFFFFLAEYNSRVSDFFFFSSLFETFSGFSSNTRLRFVMRSRMMLW